MNLLLLDADEIDDRGRAMLTDRRAEHLRRVLKVVPGQVLRGGIVDGPFVAVEVAAVSSQGAVAIQLLEPPTTSQPAAGDPTHLPTLDIELIVAMPRPQALNRVIQFAAAMAVRRIDLIAAWRVEKSFFQSPSAQPDSLSRHVRLGAEQGMQTRLPPVALHRRFLPFLELASSRDCDLRLLGHPGGEAIARATPRSSVPRRCQIAIGPEGGFIDKEVASLERAGFRPVDLGPWILRVEAAVVAMVAELTLLTRMTSLRDAGAMVE